MKLHDGLIAALVLAFAIAVLLHVRGFPPMPGQSFGPALFPSVIAAGMILGSLVMIAGALRGARAPLVEVDGWVRTPRLLLDFFLVVGGMLFYLAFSEQLGYLVTAPLTLLAFLIATGTRMIVAIPVAAAVPLLIHYIFYTLLKVPLPWGLLVEHAW